MVGREIPEIRPRMKVEAAITAPVLPAETKASAPPSRWSVTPLTMELSRLERTACAGSSSMAITSAACTTEIRERSADE